MGTKGYVNTLNSAKQRSIGAVRPVRKIRKEKVKLTFKQRIRNWIMNDDHDYDHDVPQIIEQDRLSSDGMRFQLYKAAGGFVIEVRAYDRRKDENINSMYVITEDKNLGEELGKIITMESLR